MGFSVKYLLGIDGGGTKTEFLLTDTDKNEIRRIFLGESNPNNIGFCNTEKILRQGIEEICNGFRTEEIALFAGIAGCASGANKIRLKEFIDSLSFSLSDSGGDITNALVATLDGKDGVVIIMGTGITGFCRKNNVVHRIGGWGYLIDNGGSGFCIGRDVLNSALEYYDKRGGSRLIYELCEKKLSVPLNEYIPEIYKKGPSEIASFSPVAFEAYINGDTVAEEILKRNIICASDIIKAACNISGEKKAVITGGLTKRKDILSLFFKKTLPDYDIYYSDKKSIDGAVSAASYLIKGEK